MLPPRGRRNGQPLLSNNDALQRICSLHIRRNSSVQLLEARHADSVRCHSMCHRNGNSRVMHDVGWVQQRPLRGASITKYPAATSTMLGGISRRSNDGIIRQTYMLKRIPISKYLRSEGNVTYSSVQEVESPVTFPTFPDGFIPFPRSMYRMRCWRGPPRCHDLLRYLTCRHTKLGSLG